MSHADRIATVTADVLAGRTLFGHAFASALPLTLDARKLCSLLGVKAPEAADLRIQRVRRRVDVRCDRFAGLHGEAQEMRHQVVRRQVRTLQALSVGRGRRREPAR